MDHLKLERPLVCFDLETTGTDPQRDRIVQIGLVRVEPDGTRQTFETLIDPGRPIPRGATAVHGIGDADVAGKPRFPEVAPRIDELLAGADLAGFNSIRFDLPMLGEEMRRAGRPLDLTGRRHVDAMVIYHSMERRDLSAAYRLYCAKDHCQAHSALHDAVATLEILDAQLGRYADLPRDCGGLDRFCNPDRGRWVDPDGKLLWNDEGEAVLGFGRNKGTSLREIASANPGYFDWMLGSDFPAEVKRIVGLAKQGIFPQREQAAELPSAAETMAADHAAVEGAAAPGPEVPAAAPAGPAAPGAPAAPAAPAAPRAPAPRPVNGELFPR